MRNLYVAMLAVLCILGSAFGETVDDFDGSSLVASWWGSDSLSPFVYSLGFANTEHVHSGAASLRIDFDKANDTNSPYSFLSASGFYNLSNFDYLSFWVYNTGTPVHIKVRLEDDAGNPWETDWAKIWPMMKTTNADWENLVVDLTRGFSATSVNWTAIRNIMFMVSPGDVTNHGTFWLDDVAVTRAPNEAPLEPFESDFYGWSGGGVFTNLGISTQEFQNSGTPISLGQQSLKITWPAKGENYDNFIYTPLHDTNAPVGRIGLYTNFTLYGNNTAELWVKSTTDNNLPILLKFTGSTGTSDVSSVTYTGAGNWQKLSWDFSAQSGIASKLETAWIFPYPGAADDGGTMYIDNLGLSGGTGPTLPLAPTGFVSTAGTPDEDGQFALQWQPVSGATNYILQQDNNVNFTNPVSTSTTGTVVNVSMDPVASGGTYYFRVRSVVQSSAGTFTAPLRVRVHEFPEAERKRDVIADFDSLGQVVAWWGSDTAAPWSYEQDFQNTAHVHSGDHAMRVVFNKANDVNGIETNAYSFFSASGLYNFLNFDYLSFWVYNTGAPLRIKVRLEQIGSFTNAWETDWAAIYPQMTTTQADWENITIDLTRAFFGHAHGDIDLTQIGQIMFMVEPGSTTATGEFWMDDIALHRAPNSAPLEVFESDFYGWAAGAPFSITNVMTNFYNDGGVFGLGQRSLKVSWGAKEKNFSNITYEPVHDTNGAPVNRIGMYSNFVLGGQNTIELRIKSPSDATIPILLKFDDADVGFQTYTGSGAWQNVRWEFDTIPGKTNVKKLFVIPYPNMADDGGVMYVDDLNLAGGTVPVVPYAPTNFQTAAADPEIDGSYDVHWSAVPGATSYEVQEDTDPDFGSPTSLFTNATAFLFVKDPLADEGSYYYRVRSATASGYGSFTAPIRVRIVPLPVEQKEVLADFDNAGAITAWWGSDPAEPWVYQQDFANTNHAHSGEFAMKVVYNKANEVRTNEFGQPYTNAYSFMSASGLFNLQSFDYLSFWVYNTGTPLRIKVRFEQYGDFSKAWETDWAGISPRTVTTQADWENICIDLTRTFFAQANTNIDMTKIGQIMFMIEPGSETAAGEFWMDDIALRRAPNSAPIEPFEADLYGWAGGGVFTNLSLTNGVFHNDGPPFGLGQASLRVAWNAKTQSYDNFTYEVGHDTNNAPVGRIGNYHDFTLYSNRYVELWVRSPTDTNIPILLKFDGADVGTLSYRGTGEWQRLIWSYAGLANATNVNLVYVIPFPNAADNGGVMYVDDLNLFGGQAVPIPLAPQRFRTTAKSPDGDGDYLFRWDAVQGATYEFEEDDNANFDSPVTVATNATQLAVSKIPPAAATTYYYRVRSCVGTNKSSFAAALPVTVQYQPPAQLQYENLETFDGDKQVAFWWANDPAAPYAYTLDFGSTQHVHSGVVALKVDYNKNNDVNVFSFMSAGGLFNFRNHDYLSFWVYNDGSPLKFRIRLEDNAGGFFESNWAGIEPQTKTTAADWENLVFDLSRTYAADSIDMTSVAQIMFMVAPEDGTNSGTFWMDDVQLQRAPNTAPIEPFEQDFYGWNGASHFAMELNGEAKHNDGSRTNIGQQSLRVSWTNKSQDYSSIQYDPLHDTNSAPIGRIGNYRDFTEGSNYLIEAWFMSPTEFKMPILLKLDGADVGVQNYTGEGEWEKLTWDISGIPGATNVGLMFFLPYPNRADTGGVFYVDDVNFAGGTPWQAAVAPTNVRATYPTADGQYTLSWAAASNVTGYQVLESDNGNFAYPTGFYTTNLSMAFSHHPTNDGGTYYYRVRSYEVVDGVTNVGGYSPAVSAYVPRLDGTPGQIENMSYDTTCAEVDNINVPLLYTNTSAYRITVTHPKYYPVPINERGADFDDCNFTDRNIWRIGTNDSSSAEFRQSGYGDGDVYYALDSPTAGVDEAWSEFPAALDTAVMETQLIAFTAEEISDVNLEPKIGSRLTVTMIAVSGTVDVRLVIGNGTTWSVVSNQVFDSSHLVRQWNTPDFFWSTNVDANALRLEVVTAEQGGRTTPGARADYDGLELWKRNERGESSPAVLYDDGNIIVEAIRMDFWWRAPESMAVVTPQGSVTDAQYFRIVKRVSDSNVVEYSQVFVMYEDGNVRLLPHPPKGVDWTPFGASVILGPTVEGPRPFAGIKTVTVHPKDISMDIEYDNGGSCHMDLWVDREKNVLDVSDIRYDTTTNAFARFRSMWVYDGKADIDRVESADGVYPVTRHWSRLNGTWWKFFKEVPTYHNTYCPEFDIEITDPIKAFLVRQAENFDAGSNCAVALRTNGRGGEAVNIGLEGGEASYSVYLDRGRPNTHLILRYADDDGGNNGDYPGNSVRVYVDGVLKGETFSMNSDGWNDFDMLPSIGLGDLMPGLHTIRIVVGPGTFGMDLDEFQLFSRPEAWQVPTSMLVRQGEVYNSATDAVAVSRPTAIEGYSLHMHTNGAQVTYHITNSAPVTSAYMRIRYSDDVGPTMLKVFMDDAVKARFPSLDTGTWESFTNAWELYMGDLAAGVHTVQLTCSVETWGVDVDEFEVYTKKVQNRAPQFTFASQYNLPIYTTTNIGIYAYDSDGDDVAVVPVSIPAIAGYDGVCLAVTTTPDYVGTTNTASFTADDGRGATNSSVAGSTKIIVPVDWDLDSLPDTWEWSVFTSLGLSATDDPDDDGAGNLHEYLAGTSPTQALSVFKLVAVDASLTNGFAVDVLTEPGRRYVIWLADDSIGTGSVWRTFGNTSIGVGTWIETNTVRSYFTFRDYFTASTGGAVSNSGIRHYRVKTNKP